MLMYPPPASISRAFTIASRAVALATVIPAIVVSISTGGYAAQGDGGGGEYSRTVGPAGPGKFQSADGAWWVLDVPAPNVLQFGADPTYTNDSQPAFSDAIDFTANLIGALDKKANLYIPGGKYKFNSGIAKANLYGLTIQGSNGLKAILATSGVVDIFTFDGASYTNIDNVLFQSDDNTKNANGVIYTGSSGNCMVTACWFLNFKLDGLYINGVGGGGGGNSGTKVLDCYFLSNGQSGLHGNQMMDYTVQNNQFGTLGGGITPSVGCNLLDSSAGEYSNNLHWSNQIGHKAVNCNYTRNTTNRYEINLQQGLWFEGGVKNNITENHAYSNSLAGNSLYSNIYIKNVSDSIIANNNVYRWDGSNSLYGMEFVGNCARNKIKNNKVGIDSVQTYPYYVDPAMLSLENEFDIHMPFGTGTMGNSQTVYSGSYHYSATESDTYSCYSVDMQPVGLHTILTAAPGVGQNFTTDIRKGGATPAPTITCVISDVAVQNYAGGLMGVYGQANSIQARTITTAAIAGGATALRGTIFAMTY